MKNKNLITKIALGVAIAAFVFSVVTLIRNIVLGTMVVLGVIQVVGTALVLAICVFLMVMVKRYDDMQEEGSDEEPDDEQAEEEQRGAQVGLFHDQPLPVAWWPACLDFHAPRRRRSGASCSWAARASLASGAAGWGALFSASRAAMAFSMAWDSVAWGVRVSVGTLRSSWGVLRFSLMG